MRLDRTSSPDAARTAAEKALVEPIVAKHGTAIQWSFDTRDPRQNDASGVLDACAGALRDRAGDVDDSVLAPGHLADLVSWTFGKRGKDLLR
jgi:hypothetical protein